MALRDDPRAQSVVGAAFREFWSKIGSEFASIGSFVLSLFQSLNVDQDNIEAMYDDFVELKANVETEVGKLKDFAIDPKWKSRVINVPIAITQVHDFIDLITKDFVAKVEQIVSPLHDLVLQWKTQKVTEQSGLDKPTALARGAAALKDVETTIALVRKSMDAAKDVSELFIEITDKLKKLDPLFLQQGNPRERSKASRSIRIGKLHRA